MEEQEPSYTVGGNLNWYSHYGEQYIEQNRTEEPRHGSSLNVHGQLNGAEDVVYLNNPVSLGHKMNEIMLFAATWVDLEMIILSKISHRDKYVILLICGI